ncbi:hematopoietically-expressed homeobox protein hhex-like isoform X1 [Asterias rubens]|uniref:hematopoietically-expressed homeobox protein hhex-like isoform X1 n=1 Tax=Asterias rubens TaxID=7604 RepID=UPI0014552622|nr:hematopoietically-expressed homeobox protein hhex-like isoform X1 [Asterias rubens]
MALAPSLSGHGGVYLPFQRVSAVRVQLQPVHHRSNPRPYTSFFIKDILGSKIGGIERECESTTTTTNTSCGSPISPSSSPWTAQATTGTTLPSSPSKDANFPVREATEKTLPSGVTKDANGSPLSALEELANKTFTGLETSILRAAEAATVNGKRDPLHLFNRQPPRKKRKSRTAFNNQQIFELERRFLYQKYLTPADRDEIASVLGLTNAQVITWFQNRRAKLKRDMEELNMDVTVTTKKCFDISSPSSGGEDAVAMVTKTSSSRFKEEDGDDDEDEDDRLSTLSEQQQCREQYSQRLADNSQHHLGPEESLGGTLDTELRCKDGTTPTEDCPRLESTPSLTSTIAVCGTEGEEVESMDCSTSPSSGFHSDGEDK